MGDRAHTPGPWRLDGAVIRGTRVDGKERPIVEVWRRVGGVDHEAIANANLALAAPDMFEALLQAGAWLEGWASAEPQLAIIDAALSAPAPAPESAPAPADGEAVAVGYARRDDIEAITERDEVLLWGKEFPGSVALYATTPAARSEPAAEMVEKAAREIFNRRHPHEGWDQFDERKEARGGNLHPFQEEAIEDARIALRVLAPRAPGAQEETP